MTKMFSQMFSLLLALTIFLFSLTFSIYHQLFTKSFPSIYCNYKLKLKEMMKKTNESFCLLERKNIPGMKGIIGAGKSTARNILTVHDIFLSFYFNLYGKGLGILKDSLSVFSVFIMYLVSLLMRKNDSFDGFKEEGKLFK
jgi:hypothetical protein